MPRGHNTNPERLVSPPKAFPPIETGDYLMNASRVILALAAAFAVSGNAVACDDPDHDAPAAQQQTSDQASTEEAASR